MRRWLNILVLIVLSISVFGQEETQVVDSLLNVLPAQEGREKVLTMIELTWEFHDVSYDDCLSWGERSIKEAQDLGFEDLEADAIYALGMQYGYHAELDLAQELLKQAYDKHLSIGNEKRAFEDLWNQAFFNQMCHSNDTAFAIYEKVLAFANRRNDTLAMAQTLSNMAILKYQTFDFDVADTYFKRSFDYYKLINDTVMLIITQGNIANNYMEAGKILEAKRLLSDVVSRAEIVGDYGWLMLVYKNLGQLYVKESNNHDSASFYFKKSYDIQEMLIENGFAIPIKNRVELLVEMGFSSYNQDKYRTAIEQFDEALVLAESYAYIPGQMMACFGLGSVYSKVSKRSKALYYINRFLELGSKIGNGIEDSSLRYALILNYARIGEYEEAEWHLGSLEEDYEGLLREVADLYEQNDILQQSNDDLLIDHVENSKQIAELQSQRDQYRLAFFGILAMVLSVLVLLVLYKIVRKKNSNV